MFVRSNQKVVVPMLNVTIDELNKQQDIPDKKSGSLMSFFCLLTVFISSIFCCITV